MFVLGEARDDAILCGGEYGEERHGGDDGGNSGEQLHEFLPDKTRGEGDGSGASARAGEKGARRGMKRARGGHDGSVFLIVSFCNACVLKN